MPARGIERPFEEEGEIFGDKAELFVFFACRRPREDFQGNGKQAVERPRMNGEARRQRKAELRRHDGENRALNVTVAIKEGMNFPEPAEGVAQRDQLLVVVYIDSVEQRIGVHPQFRHTRGHFAGRAEFVLNPGIDFAPGAHPYIRERRAGRPPVSAGIFGMRGWRETGEQFPVQIPRIGQNGLPAAGIRDDLGQKPVAPCGHRAVVAACGMSLPSGRFLRHQSTLSRYATCDPDVERRSRAGPIVVLHLPCEIGTGDLAQARCGDELHMPHWYHGAPPNPIPRRP